MIKKPLVSALIVTWNRKKDLTRLMKSILKQDYKPMEILVVDNKSTDGTLEYLKKLKGKVRTLVLNDNYGCSQGRNIGIKKTNGEYILSMDSDTVLHKKDSISRAVKLMNKRKDVGVINFVLYSDEKEKITFSSGMYINKEGKLSEKAFMPLKEKVFDLDVLGGSIFMIRKKAFYDVGGSDIRFKYGMEDADLGYRIRKTGWKIAADPEIKGLHLFSKAGRVKNKMSLRSIRCKTQFALKNYSKREIIDYYKRAVGNIIREFAKFFYVYYLILRKREKNFLRKLNPADYIKKEF